MIATASHASGETVSAPAAEPSVPCPSRFLGYDMRHGRFNNKVCASRARTHAQTLAFSVISTCGACQLVAFQRALFVARALNRSLLLTDTELFDALDTSGLPAAQQWLDGGMDAARRESRAWLNPMPP